MPLLNPTLSAARRSPLDLSRDLLHAGTGLDTLDDLASLRELAGELHEVDPVSLAKDAERMAFWLNIYNALFRHATLERPIAGHLFFHLGLFSRATYRIGIETYSLNAIEHGLLRGNRRPPGFPWRTMRRSDRRLAAAPSRLDPRIHFALHCGARSCPPIRSYVGERVDEQLDVATRAYFAAEMRVDRERDEVTLPRLLELYGADFDDPLAFAADHADLEDARWLRSHRPKVRFGPYDWTVIQRLARTGTSAPHR